MVDKTLKFCKNLELPTIHHVEVSYLNSVEVRVVETLSEATARLVETLTPPCGGSRGNRTLRSNSAHWL